MNDIEIEVQAFLGTDLAQSICAELGWNEPVILLFLEGAKAAQGKSPDEIQEAINRLKGEVTA